MKDLGYEVAAIGEREIAGGLDAYDALFGNVPFAMISATYTERGGDALFAPPYVVKEYDLGGRRRLKIGFLSLSSYNSTLARTGSSGKAIVSRFPADQAARYLPEVRGKADFVVLLANVSTSDLAGILQSVPNTVDLILGSFGDRLSPGGLERFMGVPALYAGDQGKRLGEVRLFVKGDKVEDLKGGFVYLTRRYPSEPRLQKSVDDTIARVNEILKAQAASKAPRPGRVAQPPAAVVVGGAASRRYMTSPACQSCHEEAYKIWKNSGHAHAMQTLEKENQDFNPECVRCHTTGFGTPAGFENVRTTPALIDVQCEACHGNAAAHLQDASQPYGRVAPRVCYSCHTRENSPDFSFFKYWEQIKH